MTFTITSSVYSRIRDGDYANAIQILQSNLEDGAPRSQPVLSLFAYCFYQEEEYSQAAEVYEELLEICPSSEQYQLYHVQSLVNAGSYADASRAAASSTVSQSSPFFHRMKLLQAQAQAEQNFFSEAAAALAQCNQEDIDTVLSLAGIHFRNNDYNSALDKYNTARLIDERPSISYCIALCYHQLEDHEQALRTITDTIETFDVDESTLVEIYNLKAAILHATKDGKAAKATLAELGEDEDFLDTITLHNNAIVNFGTDPTGAIQTLESIIAQETCPSETLQNILLMYLNQGHNNLVVENFEAYKHAAEGTMPHETYAYIEAAITAITSPFANATLDNLVAEYAKRLKLAMKRLGTSNTHSIRAATASSRPGSSRPMSRRLSTAPYNPIDVANATKNFEANVEQFVQLLMLQAKVFWDQGEFATTESFLQQSSEILHGNDIFNENMAHALFIQSKFEESISYYEMLINSHSEASSLLDLPAMSLANLVVAYILTSRNEEAEAIMKAIEREEDDVLAMGESLDSCYHNSIVNLAVGTLYCEKGNYEFGISRIRISLDDKNLSPDTWFYTKRCFLALASKISKLMFIQNLETNVHEIIDFLDDIENEAPTIASEARQLKQMFFTLAK